MQVNLITERTRLADEVERLCHAYFKALGALEYVEQQLAQMQADRERPAYKEGADPPPEAPGTFLEG